MSFKTTYILFAILAAMLGCLVLALIFGPDPSCARTVEGRASIPDPAAPAAVQ